MKINVFDIKNVLITLKAFVISIVIAIVDFIARLIMLKMPVFGAFLLVLWSIFTLFLWGYLARIWWKWK